MGFYFWLGKGCGVRDIIILLFLKRCKLVYIVILEISMEGYLKTKIYVLYDLVELYLGL